MSTIYAALTIGPIYDTFSLVKRTRSIWAASYFFAFFTRKVLEEAIAEGWEILLPCDECVSDGKNFIKINASGERVQGVNKGIHGAGLYADRLYFINRTKLDVDHLIENAIDFFAIDMTAQLYADSYESAKTYLSNYLNVHVVEISFDDNELCEIVSSKDENGKSNNSVLKILNNLLDNKELNRRYVFSVEKELLIDYFSSKWNDNTALKIDSFGEETDRNFTSIGEISAIDLKSNFRDIWDAALQKDFKNPDIEFIEQLAETTRKDKAGNEVSIVEPYHRYYAVLYADGDNISELLTTVANDGTALKTFSAKLFEFGLQAEQSIKSYGGSAIYLGGEDILAFLPIAFKRNKNVKSLAHLIHDLDKGFQSTLGNYAKDQEVTIIPTLSYGIMIAYYKYPMREAMSQAHDLLKKSKKASAKNTLSVRFQKHSGQFVECSIDKAKKASTLQIYRLLTKHIQATDKKNTLSGLIHRLQDNLFFTAFVHAVRDNHVDAFFENFFNEDIHEVKSTFSDYFKELTTALKSDYLTQCNTIEEKNAQNALLKDILFTVMRYYHFIQPEKY